MAVFAALSGLVALIVAGVVTTRLFALARRNGGAPERLLATSFAGLFCVGYPLTAASRAPGLEMTVEGALLFVLGTIGIVIGCVALGRFPYVVFRPGNRWARLLNATLGLAGLVAGIGIAVSVATAASSEAMRRDIQPWAVLLLVTIASAYFWNAYESTIYYGRMKRRLALGLARPDVTHRFLLWAIASWCSALPIAAIGALRALGTPILSARPMALIACTTLVTSTCWWLAFFMPAWYRGRVLAAPPPESDPTGP